MPTTDLPVSFHRIELVLAHNADRPVPAREQRISLIAPLDGDGHLDVPAWEQHRTDCKVVRRRLDRHDDIGHLERSPRGEWGFRYDVACEAGDSALRTLDAPLVRAGALLHLHQEDGVRDLYVVSVSPVGAH